MFIETVKYAIKHLLQKKLRTLLTLLSMSIGVASVCVIGIIGQTGKQIVADEIGSLGLGAVTIGVDKRLSDVSMTNADLQTIRRDKAVESAVPMMVNYSKMAMRSLVSQAVIFGVDSGPSQIISLNLKYGRMISKDDILGYGNVCVLDENAARIFYGRDNVVGKKARLYIGGSYAQFDVVGIASSGGSMLQKLLYDLPCLVYVPYTTNQYLLGQSGFDQAAVQIRDAYDPGTAADEIISRLTAANGGKTAYRAENIAQQKDKLGSILNTVTFVLTAVASISLVVAGFGVMTVMLSSVGERTREIGIKKAIGARRKDIVLEFLTEAFTLAILSSAIGCAAGILGTALGCRILSVAPVISLPQVGLCVFVTLAIGVLFGVYPASLAAGLNPVDALRYE